MLNCRSIAFSISCTFLTSRTTLEIYSTAKELLPLRLKTTRENNEKKLFLVKKGFAMVVKGGKLFGWIK